MCATEKIMEERGCAGGCVISPARFRQGVLWFAGIVVFFANLAWFMHFIEVILLTAGALSVAAVTAYVRWVVPWRRRQAQAVTAGWHQAAAMHQPAAQPLRQAQAAPQIHYHGNVLSLPSVTGDELAQAMRRQQ